MQKVWEAVLEDLRGRLSAHTFAAWLAPLELVGLEGGVLQIRIPHRFFADWIAARYLPDLVETMARRAGAPVSRVEWVIDESIAGSLEPPATERGPSAREARVEVLASRRASARPRARERKTGELPFPSSGAGAPAPAQRPERSSVAPPRPLEEDTLNPRYRFESFVVGPSNQLAHAAAVFAASAPGKRYNPLFIYSNVGLGKTHLVNAVGHRVREERPDARVLFISAEHFTNEFISALQHRSIDEFRARYRTGCDVLIIDDIQFLATREQTQEEFFHTFNALYHADKQIVVTSDVYPQQIKEMQDRLISRFQWGLVADIQAPELDTRIAILRKKAELESIALDDAVALFVAQRVESNVRELEGTLLRLAVRADVEGRPIDLALAQAMLGSASRPSERLPSVEEIQRAAAEYFGIGMKELLSGRRHRGVSQPRMLAMFVTRELLRLSYPEIGRRFGGRDHTTVISAHRKIEAQLPHDERLQRALESIQKKLGLG